jgi:predicted nucleic acid-binding protein
VSATIVIDADAAIFLGRNDWFERFANGWQLVAPTLMWSETRSALFRESTRRPSEASDHRSTFARICAADITELPIDRSAPWDIAELLGWSKSYDAEYLALARELRAGLFTLDRQLRHGARTLGIELVQPA